RRKPEGPMIRITAKFVTLLAGVVLACGIGVASAQDLQQQIENSLQPRSAPGLTRGLGGGATRSLNRPKAARQQPVIKRLRTRSIAVESSGPVEPEERAKIAEIVKEKPSIDLEIYFDYNSAEIGPKALPALIALGNVLSKEGFKGTVFFINGHTDAAGG